MQMSSLKQCTEIESQLISSIQESEKQIADIQHVIVAKKARLCTIQDDKHTFQEQAFEKMYGISAASVRKQYVELVTRCSGACDEGHSAKVPGYVPRGTHVCVLPQHYEVCKPTPLVIEAFATVDQQVWIEPIAHREYWGN